MKRVVILVLTVLAAGGCSEPPAAGPLQGPGPGDGKVVREVDPVLVGRGGRVFSQNCAECHGGSAEGAANWRQADAQGFFPAPPLNGTGHAWHHPDSVLRRVIMDGSPGGQGRMPAWRDRLSEEEVTAVIAWFKAQWPDEVYAAWQQMNERAKAGS